MNYALTLVAGILLTLMAVGIIQYDLMSWRDFLFAFGGFVVGNIIMCGIWIAVFDGAFDL